MSGHGTPNGRPPLIYRQYLVWVWQYGSGWYARLESVDGSIIRTVHDRSEAWRALDRALDLIDKLVNGAAL